MKPGSGGRSRSPVGSRGVAPGRGLREISRGNI